VVASLPAGTGVTGLPELRAEASFSIDLPIAGHRPAHHQSRGGKTGSSDRAIYLAAPRSWICTPRGPSSGLLSGPFAMNDGPQAQIRERTRRCFAKEPKSEGTPLPQTPRLTKSPQAKTPPPPRSSTLTRPTWMQQR
jgi:hypothetical protein